MRQEMEHDAEEQAALVELLGMRSGGKFVSGAELNDQLVRLFARKRQELAGAVSEQDQSS